MLTEKDCQDIEIRGITVKEIEEQLRSFREGFPFLPITRPATSGDGILKLSGEIRDDLIRLYEKRLKKEIILKFVPASGIASRMFKDLYAFLEKGDKYEDRKYIEKFIRHLSGFAFYDELKSCLIKKGYKPEYLIKSGDYTPIIRTLLEKDGLNYANLPKGLIPFHKYGEKTRTAFEEHLAEGAMYCKGNSNIVRIHFTVLPQHKEAFTMLLDSIRKDFEKKYGVEFVVDFSIQKPSTDTIAADRENKPFRNKDGKLVFRPGGHGALLKNINELNGDIIFIKNIDNVVPDNLKHNTIRYKKVLGGMLISFRERIFDYLNALEIYKKNDKELLNEIMTFLEDELCVVAPPGMDQWREEKKKKYLVSKLDRPIRICGMVKNEGQPGGGPFWVKNSDGSVSLQIVESSQIDLSDSHMNKLFNASTHFNPVDLVCSFKDYKGNKFDLQRFVDPQTGFISRKSVEGKELKALELPGLWNGSMSDWNTVFIEIPLSAFNPVKTVTDLLKSSHAEQS